MRSFVDWSYRTLRFLTWVFRAFAAVLLAEFAVGMIAEHRQWGAFTAAGANLFIASLLDALAHHRRPRTVKVTLEFDDSKFREAMATAASAASRLNRRLDGLDGTER